MGQGTIPSWSFLPLKAHSFITASSRSGAGIASGFQEISQNNMSSRIQQGGNDFILSATSFHLGWVISAGKPPVTPRCAIVAFR
jgi:hypothetical protein